MIAILALSLVVLFVVLTALEFITRETPIEWAESGSSLHRFNRIQDVTESIDPERRAAFLTAISECHEGYTLTARPFERIRETPATEAVRARLARRLSVDESNVSVGEATLTRADFTYGECNETEIDLPMDAVVVSLRLSTGEWLNAEVHPHEWHLDTLLTRILRYSAACLFVGVLAIFTIHRLSKPLNQLTRASQLFGEGLVVSPVPETGPRDLRRAIESFNTMQRQVAGEVKRRTDTLTAISHDLRTPLTALRIKAELIEDETSRAGLVASIEKMERMTASALEFLRGEARSEPLRTVNLSAMLASECAEFDEGGQRAEYIGEQGVNYRCRPDALARAVRNLIENANKYANGATVNLRSTPDSVEIAVSDTGPGIPEDQFELALEPFSRLSTARESQQGGFGLGLAVVQAIARGHGGELRLSRNSPTGLVATIRLPGQVRASNLA